MIVLVDTSVWIRFLANLPPYAAELDRLLSRDEATAHDLVYGELLIGDKGGRKQLLANYKQMHQAPVVAHGEVVEFVRERLLHGGGVGWIDAHLLASAIVGRLKLWTADPRLATLAKELGIAYSSFQV
jgi:predicted nucleic acid-binding protein